MQRLRERLAERGRDTAHAEARERWLNALETLASIDAATRPGSKPNGRRSWHRPMSRCAAVRTNAPAPGSRSCWPYSRHQHQRSPPWKPAALRRAPAEPDAQFARAARNPEAAPSKPANCTRRSRCTSRSRPRARGLRTLDAAARRRRLLAELRDWALRPAGARTACLAAEGLVPDAWAPAELARACSSCARREAARRRRAAGDARTGERQQRLRTPTPRRAAFAQAAASASSTSAHAAR